MRLLLARTLFAALVVCGAIGCTPPASNNTITPPVATEELDHMHGDHKHAATYAEAISMIETMNTEISTAFADGKPMAADETVHSIGHTLEDVTSLAKKALMSEEDQNAIGVAVETLLDAFGKVDEKLHGGEGADYSAVADEVNTAMETLKKFASESK